MKVDACNPDFLLAQGPSINPLLDMHQPGGLEQYWPTTENEAVRPEPDLC